MKWLFYAVVVGFVAYNWDPIDLSWWQWYLMIGLTNYVVFSLEHREWRYNDPGAFVEWAFFVFLWPVQLGFWLLTSANNVSGWVLERVWR